MKLYRFFAFLLLFFTTATYAKDNLSVEANRTQLQVGETLQLTITASGQNISSKPNFSQLETDFSILASSMKTQLMVVNGDAKSSTSWQLTLSPKHAGDITIPVFKVGDDSSHPIVIHVGTSSASNNTNKKTEPAKDVIQTIFLKAQGTPSDIYVQSEGVYTLRLYYNQTVQNAQFSDPTAENASIFRIGQDAQHQETINGKPYEVLERHYAVIPHKAGHLTIDPPTFSGNVMSYSQLSNANSSIFSSGWEPMSTRANPVTFQVKPTPLAAKSGWWLPAESVSIHEQWSQTPPNFKVGQPITRTITIEATGTTAETLPDLSQTSIPNVQVYPDKPSLDTSTDGKLLTSKREQKFAMIPNKSGKLTLPAVKVTWWNIKTDKSETISIPEQTFEITGEANNVVSPEPANMQTSSDKAESKTETPWMWIAAALCFLILWIITIAAWWMNRRQPALSKPIESEIKVDINLNKSLQEARTCLQKACHEGDPFATKNAMIAWAAQQWPQENIRHLGDVEKMMSQESASQAIHFLDQHLYAQKNQKWDGPQFWDIIEKELVAEKRTTAKPNDDYELPSLHPKE